MGIQSTPLSPSFNGRVVKDDANDRFYVTDDNNVPIALFGKDAAQNIVVKVAQSGYNVITASDSELIFNSADDMFKIIQKPTTGFALTSGSTQASTTASIIHNLGYEPLVFCTVNITTGPQTGIFPLPFVDFGTSSNVPDAFVVLSYVKLRNITDTELLFEVGIEAASQTIDGVITAYILQETAS